MEAKLIVIGGKANKSEVKLKLPTTIGRSKHADLTVAHPKVSRRHCQIYERQGALVVRDNSSLNGTYIGDTRITEAVLRPGDKLTIGPLTFVAVYEFSGEFPQLDTPPAGVPTMVDPNQRQTEQEEAFGQAPLAQPEQTPAGHAGLPTVLPAFEPSTEPFSSDGPSGAGAGEGEEQQFGEEFPVPPDGRSGPPPSPSAEPRFEDFNWTDHQRSESQQDAAAVPEQQRAAAATPPPSLEPPSDEREASGEALPEPVGDPAAADEADEFPLPPTAQEPQVEQWMLADTAEIPLGEWANRGMEEGLADSPELSPAADGAAGSEDLDVAEADEVIGEPFRETSASPAAAGAETDEPQGEFPWAPGAPAAEPAPRVEATESQPLVFTPPTRSVSEGTSRTRSVSEGTSPTRSVSEGHASASAGGAKEKAKKGWWPFGKKNEAKEQAAAAPQQPSSLPPAAGDPPGLNLSAGSASPAPPAADEPRLPLPDQASAPAPAPETDPLEWLLPEEDESPASGPAASEDDDLNEFLKNLK